MEMFPPPPPLLYTLSQNSAVPAAWLIGLKLKGGPLEIRFKTNQPGCKDPGVLRESWVFHDR